MTSLIDRIFGRTPPKARNSQAHSQPSSQNTSQLSSVHSQMSAQGAATLNATRRELLRVVLRDTLTRHGIPTSWITADMLVATSRQREPGIHWRLSIKHWDMRLMTHTVAIQNALIKRVMSFDPLATTWLMGISWQLALEDESACPLMPHPGVWTQEPHRAVAPVVKAEIAGGSGDVISGPVLIGTQSAPDTENSSAREDLEKLFAVRDADMARNGADNAHTFAATEPAKL